MGLCFFVKLEYKIRIIPGFIYACLNLVSYFFKLRFLLCQMQQQFYQEGRHGFNNLVLKRTEFVIFCSMEDQAFWFTSTGFWKLVWQFWQDDSGHKTCGGKCSTIYNEEQRPMYSAILGQQDQHFYRSSLCTLGSLGTKHSSCTLIESNLYSLNNIS